MNKYLQALYSEEIPATMCLNGLWMEYNYHENSPPMDIISGSFNPLHAGHLNMAHYSLREKRNVYFEIPIFNCDKGFIDESSLMQRVRQFYSICRGFILTLSPNFVGKANLFPNSRFLVGADTIERVGNVKYYFNSEKEMDYSFISIKANNCSFVVMERNGRTLKDVIIPDSLRELCVEAEGYKSIDISSTELRNKNGT